MFLIIILFFLNIIKFDYKYAHQSSMVYNQPLELHKYFIFKKLKNFLNSFYGNRKLEKFKNINIFIEEQNLRKLLEKTPLSTKEWVNAKMEYDNDKIKKIKFRYRGDNPANWLFQKKTFKIKTRKNELINNFRSFDYFIYSAEHYLSYLLTEEGGRGHGLYYHTILSCLRKEELGRGMASTLLPLMLKEGIGVDTTPHSRISYAKRKNRKGHGLYSTNSEI